MSTSAAKFSKMEASSFWLQIIQRCMQMHHLPRPQKPSRKASKQSMEDLDVDAMRRLYAMMGNLDAWLVLPLNVLLARLDDPDSNVRTMALAALESGRYGKIEPAMIVQFAYAVIGKLYDSSALVRTAALCALCKLEPVTLAQHANAIVEMLADSSWEVRRQALNTLCKLGPLTLAQHARAVITKLEDSSEHVRNAALTTLAALPPSLLATCARGYWGV